MAENRSEHIVKSVSMIVVFTIIFKVLGFCREFFLSFFWGTSGVSDAFLISQTIPGTLFQFVGVGLTTCFIPVYYSVLKQDGQQGANRFTNKLTTLILLFSTLLILLVWMDTPLFVKIFASGFSDETLDLACVFTRIGILSLYFSTFAFVYESYLQANQNFLPGAITSVLQSALVLVALYLGAKINLWILPVGCALSIGIRVLAMYPATAKTGLRFAPDFKWKDDQVRYFGKLLVPVIIGCAVNEINVIFDKTIASRVTVGAISALTYSNSLVQLINGGLVQPVSTVFYPYISNHISDGNRECASAMLKKSISALISMLLPIMVFFMLFSRHIVEVLFGRGAFDDTSVSMTSGALFYYMLSVCFLAIREMVSRYYFASGDTKTPMYNAAIGVVFNIVLNIILARFMGVSGLALATSCSAVIIAGLLMFTAKKRLHLQVSDIIDAREMLRVLEASLIMAAIALLAHHFLRDMAPFYAVLISAFLCGSAYFFIARKLNLELVSTAQEILLKVFKR